MDTSTLSVDVGRGLLTYNRPPVLDHVLYTCPAHWAGAHVLSSRTRWIMQDSLLIPLALFVHLTGPNTVQMTSWLKNTWMNQNKPIFGAALSHK